jgi:hypothetical protein
MTRRILLLAVVFASTAWANDAIDTTAPKIERFTCRFDPYHRSSRRDDRFLLCDTAGGPVFDVRFGNTIGNATLERHEAAWPEPLQLRITGERRGFIVLGLKTETGFTESRTIELGKVITYHDARGVSLPGPAGSAYRIETQRVAGVVNVTITTSPEVRTNRQWHIRWYAAGW